MKTKELRKIDKKELEKSVYDLRKRLSDLRFKFSSNKLKNVKEISQSKKEIAKILTILRENSPVAK
ncbi:MAG: 50S ribosomal protein L29 [Patescibacteria group bacterium]